VHSGDQAGRVGNGHGRDAPVSAEPLGFGQLVRAAGLACVDVLGGMEMVDQHRDPRKACFVLLTPEIFKANKEYRFYGHLYHQYRDPELGVLQRHLAGRSTRSAEDLATVPDRLGWLTWEDCHKIEGDACPWLGHPNHTY